MIFFSIKMQSKYMLLFVLIASIKLVYSGSLLGGSLLGGGSTSYDGSRVNEDGLLHSLDKPLDKTVCSAGLACPDKTGPLAFVDPLAGPLIKGLGIGIDGDEYNNSNGRGNGGSSGCKDCGCNGNGNNGNGNNGNNGGGHGGQGGWNNGGGHGGQGGWNNGGGHGGQGGGHGGNGGNGGNGGDGSNCGCS